MTQTVRLTTAQALVKFLSSQYSERDGLEQRLVTGILGIFGHGNVAGVGQALLQAATTGEADLPYYLARNEQGMVHASVGYARTLNRLQALACTASVGPGSTNMLTGAAVATTNRQPVLLLPSDIFATRVGSPVLQELEHPTGYDVQASDAFRPLSRFFERVWRPEMLPHALLGGMRVLTDQAETGAVTIALPQDVQAEAFDWPEELFAKRVWHITRPAPDPAAVARAVEVLRSARKPLIVAGGGLLYSEATEELRSFAERQAPMASAMSAGEVASVIASYNQRVRAHLMRFHSYPSGGNGQRGVARLSFTLSRSGQVTGSRAGGSGVAAFDAQAMSMIRQASPFPPFPAEIKNGSMSFSIPVEFTVR